MAEPTTDRERLADALVAALTDGDPVEAAWPLAMLQEILDQLDAEEWTAGKKDPEGWNDLLRMCRLMLARAKAALRPLAERQAEAENVPAPAAGEEDIPF